MPHPAVLVFLKAPRPGTVKTRLAADLGEGKACEIYRDLAERTLALIPCDYQTFIHFAPPDARREMEDWLGLEKTFFPQCEGDLGERLSAACEAAFENGAPGVILLGGDCPGIRKSHLARAEEVILQGEAVIGPAVDGGYWLLGLPRRCPQVFQNIRWSTPEVLPATLERLAGLKLPVDFLDELEDIDDLSTWQRATEKFPDLI